jgi:hypothetical protein
MKRFLEKKQSTIEGLYERHMRLQIRQARFEKHYYNAAAELEKKRDKGGISVD